MSARSNPAHRRSSRTLATGLSIAMIAAGATVIASATSAQAATVKAFTQDYSAQLYGDFLEVGNSSVVCPTNATTDPVRDISGNGSTGNTVAQCTTAQQRGQQNFGNDAYRMIQANPSAGVLNSSQATLTIPPGATVAFARLNWSANTGVLENAAANGQVAYASCGTGDTQTNPAVNPTGFGTYTTNPVKLVANGRTGSYAPGSSLQVDPLASLAANSPQYYSAFADVTAQLAGATTGTPIPVTVQNVWGPSGFNCYGGWSLTVVYSYPTANASFAPLKRQVYVYNGHVRQQAADPATTISIPNLRLATSDSHIGVTAYEGDYNITGDQLLVNGTAIADPLTTGNATPTTNNFFVGNANGNGTWSGGTAGGTFTAGPPNVFSVDAKSFTTQAIKPLGSTPSTATLTLQTSGDSYLAQEVVLSSPLPDIAITKTTSATVVRAGGTAQFQIQVSNPTPSALSNVVVTDTKIPACDNQAIGTLAGNSVVTYTCTGTVPNDGSTSFVNTASTSGTDYTGAPVTGTASSPPITVIHPSISLTKTADKALYTAGGTVTFTIVAKNTGDAALSGVAVTDPNAPNCARTIGALAAGASTTITCTTTAPVTGGSNTASVVGTDPTGQTVTATANAPAPTAGSVNGTVFADTNNDGVINGNDTGIPGVTVTLRAADGTTTTTTTDARGNFSFPGLAPATYTLTETQPAGYADGKDTPGTNSVRASQNVFTVTVPDNGASAGNLFGEVPSDSLAGVVYVDSNNDGTKAGTEPGIGGVAVNLTGTDDGGNSVSLSTLTAADGTYGFAALRPGVYTITEIQPAGYVQGKDAAGTPPGSTTTQDRTSGITLSGANTAGTGYNFGELVAASLSGQVFTDKGTPLAGVALTLTGTDDRGAAVSVPVTTDATGAYIVTGLRPGTYTISETQPAAYGAGSVVAGSAGGAVNGANSVTTIPLTSGSTATGYNFTETTASLTGSVFSDPNNNGVRETGETGIGGVTVQLTGTGADGRTISKTTTTDTNGAFTFTDLPAGTGFTLTETQPTAYLTGKNATGTFGGTISGDTVSGIAITAGAAGTGYTFGEVAPASITGVVVDQSGNPEPGVTVTLGGSGTGTATTAADGSYGFTGLYPGTYTVTEQQPAGLGDGTDTVGKVNGTTTGSAPTVNTLTGIALPAGGAGTGYNFSDVAGSLSGHVYVDANNNGTFDSGETPIGGVTVTLSNGLTTKTATTAADGSYTFGGLAAGTYAITETQPAGYVNGSAHVGSGAGGAAGTAATPDQITGIGLGSGSAGVSYDFGELRTASIAGSVKDDTGAPIAGVTVTLTPTAGGAALTTTTAADGTWSFTGVVPGSYAVTETQPTGYGDTAPNPAVAGTSGGTVSGTNAVTGITLGSGATATGYTFTDSTATVSGSVYVDANGNGTRDSGESGIGGVSVTIAGGPGGISRTVTTDASGAFAFAGLVAGSYTLTEAQPTTYNQGTDRPGTTVNGTVTQTSTTDTVSGITVAAGAAYPGYLFGEFAPTGLSGTVRDDKGNALAGVTVNVLNGAGAVVATTTTLSNGSFAFTTLAPGTYSLQEVQPTAYGAGTATAGTVGTTTDGTVSNPNLITNIVLASGQSGTGYAFVDTSATISGRVFVDRNGDNAFNGADTGIGSVTLTATNGTLTRTTTTAADGSWSFTGLPAGTWTVTETQPNGYTSGTDTPGSPVNGSAANDGVTISGITVAAGTAYAGYLYPEVVPASLAGTVRDSSGLPLAGVTVTLSGPTPTVVTTAADGSWIATGLLPGTYTITETQPADYGNGSSTAGTLGGTSGVNVTSNVPVTSGVSGTGYDFTDQAGSLAGTVFYDKNNNGALDSGEPGISGVTVTVTGTSGTGVAVSRTTTTAADGTFTVTGLPRGTYQLTETQPSGYTSGTDTAGTPTGTLSATDTFTGIALGAGQAGTGYRFGEYTSATLSGTVRDQSFNGLPGATVTITDGTHTYTPAIAANGTWTVTGIVPGTYSITETNPAGYGNITAAAGTDGGTVNDPDHIVNVVVTAGSTGSGYVFVDRTGSIAGTVYLDSNGDGVQDGNEGGLSGVTVTLTSTALPGPVVTTTNAGGAFSFTGLLAGTYTITETQPAAYAQGTDVLGTGGGTVTQTATTDTVTGVTLTTASAASQTATGYVFGEEPPASLSGSVLLGTTGEAGVTVTLSGTTDRGAAFSATTTTDAGGSFAFTAVPPGTYTVAETQPTAYGPGAATPGTVDGLTTGAGTATDPNTIGQVVLGGGDKGAGYTFTDVGATVSGTVYDDLGNNGQLDNGDPPVAGVTVTLTDGGSTTVTTTTAADGTFSFANLPAGTYTLTKTPPSGYLSGTDTPGTGGGQVSTDGNTISGITVAAGGTASGNLFAEITNGALAGSVRDSAGNPLAGVTITLHDTSNPGTPDLTTTTAPDGTWSFGTVPADTYTLTETQPAGYGNGSVTVGTAGGAPSTDGNSVTGILVNGSTRGGGYAFVDTASSLAGLVFVDANGNRAADNGEQGLSGVTVTVSSASAGITRTVATDPSGAFTATGLPAANDYLVTESQPAGYLSENGVPGTFGAGSSTGTTFTGVIVPVGTAGTGYLFPEYQDATISGAVTDTTGAGIPGATVTLRDSGGTVVGTTTTGSDGSWTFTVAPGSYSSIEADAPGYGSVSAAAGTAGGTVTDPNTITAIPLTSGQSATGYRFVDTLGGISGTVYVDSNGNGTLDTGEAPIAGVTVTLTGTTAAGATINVATTTLANGAFRFTNVPAGTYTLTETQPAGYAQGKDAAGTVAGAPSGNATTQDVISGITLAGGQSGTGFLFGEQRFGSVNGVVDLDRVGGTVEDGVTVTLTDGAGNTFTAQTAGGAFSFPAVPAGTYTLTETQPTQYGTGAAFVNGVQQPAANQITGIVVGQGTSLGGYAFTDTSASVAGTVFVDSNGNGVLDAGELGIGGVAIAVTGGGNTYQATTAGDGTWSATGLPALPSGQSYTVTETQPAGYLSGTDTAGTANGVAQTDGVTITGVTPTPGQQATGYLFAEYTTGSVTGTVVDSAGNPIAGVTITLNGPSSNGATVVTGADGRWTFSGLVPGSYTVTETQPVDYGEGSVVPGTLHGTPNGPDQLVNIPVTSGAAGSGAQFVDTLGSLRTTVYVDANNSGTKDAGEAGIAGVTVTLNGVVDGAAITPVVGTTDATGAFTFGALKAGTYTITETQPAGYAQGKDSAGTPAGTTTTQDVIAGIPLAGGQAGTGYRFGEQTFGSLAGTVTLDGKPEAGQTVRLTGTSDTGASVAVVATSQPDGSYTFTNVPPGTYAVSEDQPTAYGNGTATAGTAGGTVTGANTVSGVVLTAGATATGYAFTDTGASIAGSVFVDADGNNAKGAGESGLGGVVVQALDGTGAVVASATTGSDGSFTITGLPAGTYTVAEQQQPAGYASGTDNPGSTAAVGGTTTGDTITGVTAAPGGAYNGVLFPEYQATTIGGTVTDSAGHPIAGVTITVTGPSGALPPITTGANGSWTSPALPPGTYRVVETQPTAYGAGTPVVGNLGGTPNGADEVDGIVVRSGTAGTGYGFVDTLGSIAGVVFDDGNGNGVQDGTDAPIPGVTITALDASGAVAGTATSGTDGSWTITGLVGGTYTLVETQPAGYASGTDTPGNAGGTALPDGTTFQGVTLGGGQAATGYRYAEYKAATISGTVATDLGAGVQGVTVTISGPTLAAPLPVTTNAQGQWTSPGLPPGTYTVTETQPAQYGTGTDALGNAGGVLTDPNTITGVTVGSGGSAAGYSFTDTTASLSGVVFVDGNADGVQGMGDAGLPGVTLTLTGPTGSQPLTTDGSGRFAATGLPAGSYTLTEAQPAGYTSGPNHAGPAGGTVNGDTISAITVVAGTANPGYTFSEFQQAVVTGTVRDELGDPISGVTVTATDGAGNAFPITTGSDGTWSLTLPPGTYTITETQPAQYGNGTAVAGVPDGGTPSTDGNSITGVTVSSGSKDSGYAFTDTTASVSGTVFTDRNGNGVPDGTDTPIAGVTVTVLAGTTTVGSAVTDGNGAWKVAGLLAGTTYTIVETQPSGVVSGTDTAGTAGGTPSADGVTITGVKPTAGQQATGYLFPEYVPSTIGGTVLDQNGKPLTGVTGVTITIVDPVTGATVATAVTATDGTGSWSVTGLPPGTYDIVETQPAGYGDGQPVVGTGDFGTANGPNRISGVTVASGSTGTGYGFQDVSASLSGLVYVDTDGSGAQDPGEPGIPNVQLQVVDGSGRTVATPVTDGQGRWTVADLPAGSYTVTENQPAGYLSGADSAGTPAGSTATQDVIAAIPLAAGQAGTGYDFAEYTATSLTGFVVDDDGKGIGGVTVSLVDAAGNVVATQTTTPTTGAFTFGPVLPGTYSVVETQPTGYGTGSAIAGTLGGTVTDPNTISAIGVRSGAAGTGYVFTDPASSISGRVFLDANGDGTFDGTDTGLVTTVQLLSGTTVVGSTTSAADGTWTIADVPAGTYQVVETQPTGYVSGKDTPGTAGGTDDGNGTSFSGVVLPVETAATGYTFAEYVLSGLTGTVTDSTGAPLAGVTVTISGGGLTAPIPVNTDGTGTYTVPNLPPGSYTVTETQPAGYGTGTATPGTDGGTATDGNTVTGVTVGSGTSGAGTGPSFVDAAASLSGQVFLDRNGNGAVDAGEAGLGTPVTLTLTDAAGNSRTLTADPTTGAFSVAGLQAGTYQLVETQPAGYASGTDVAGTPAGGTVAADGTTITDIVVAAGSTNTGYLYPEVVLSPVSGVVKDPAGTGIAGVLVTATNAAGTSVAVTTGADGSWTLPLPPGTWTITETNKQGYGDVSSTVGTVTGTGTAAGTSTDPNTISGVVITSGSSGSGYAFTDTLGSLKGVVFADADGNGVQGTGELGIGGVTITVVTPSGTVAGQTTTAADGSWTVAGLPTGTYTVVETQPTGYGDGTATAGTAGGTPSADGNQVTGVQITTAAENGTGYVFADTTGALSGTVFYDADGNGVQDAGEPGIGGVTITLTDATGATTTTTTQADGTWTKTGLRGGTYTVTETQPAGYADGTDTVGTGGGTAVAPDSFTGVTVTPDTNASGYTFAEIRGAITGIAFLDVDRDGVYTPGVDKPEAGVTVTLTGPGGATQTVVTKADGSYVFTGLAPGAYTVTETQPPGYGSDTPDTVTVDLTPTAAGGTANFGDQGATIGDTVWSDTNRDGVREPGEPGVAGVTLTLYGADGSPIATTTSDQNGSYAFLGLPAGTYTVGITLPNGQTLTTENRASGSQTGSAFDQTTLRTAPITITVSTAGVITDDLAADAGIETAAGDLTVTTSGPTGPVVVGTPVVGTVTVTNDGNTPQPGATVTVTVPPGQTPTTVGGSTWTCTAAPATAAGTVVTCTSTSPIPPGESAPPLTVTTVPTQVGAAPVSVTVSPVAGGVDTTTTNDTATIPVTVVAGTSTGLGSGGGTGGAGGSGGSSSGGGLPFTGLDAAGLVGLAIVSMLSGLLLLVVGRRRRPLA